MQEQDFLLISTTPEMPSEPEPAEVAECVAPAVVLTSEQRAVLEALSAGRRTEVRMVQRARIVLLAVVADERAGTD